MNHKISILFSHVVVVVVVFFLYLFLLINIIIVWNMIYIMYEKYCNERISEQLKSNMIFIRYYQLSFILSI